MNSIVLKEELMDKSEYLKRALEVTDISLRDSVNDKAKAYQRLEEYMKRDQLAMENATYEDICAFLKDHGTVIGKINDTDGKNFHVYDISDSYAPERIIKNAPDVLEEYIIQHHEYSEIYDKSVNTLRIHTVRNSREIRLAFNPLLSIGAAGSLTDHPICNKALRILLTQDGTIISGVDRWRCYEIMSTHPDTGYIVVPGKKLPYVLEACEMCLKAAVRFPELRYLGWDVAITEKGPVIVEVNSISGLAPKYCSAAELKEMFRFVSEGVGFCLDTLMRGNRFVPEINGVPDKAQTFLLCLEAALHRHGIEFSNNEDFLQNAGEEIHCGFQLDLTGSILTAEIDSNRKSFVLDIPSGNVGDGDVFEIDSQASECADYIYRQLRKMHLMKMG